MPRKVGIINYGLCNIDSIARAIEINGGQPLITSDPTELKHQDLLVLPGVGSFAKAMQNLNEWGLSDALRDEVGKGTPLLGICLGMQLLASDGEEHGQSKGLGFFEADVVRLRPQNAEERVPHMGWNEVNPLRDDILLDGIEAATDFYFVHSYHMQCRNDADVVARAPFAGGFSAIVRNGYVAGTQFHPEKSWPHGHRVLANFISKS